MSFADQGAASSRSDRQAGNVHQPQQPPWHTIQTRGAVTRKEVIRTLELSLCQRPSAWSGPAHQMTPRLRQRRVSCSMMCMTFAPWQSLQACRRCVWPAPVTEPAETVHTKHVGHSREREQCASAMSSAEENLPFYMGYPFDPGPMDTNPRSAWVPIWL